MRVEVRPAASDDWATWRALRLEALADTPLGFVETLEAAGARRRGSGSAGRPLLVEPGLRYRGGLLRGAPR